jgi:hypothetical protein
VEQQTSPLSTRVREWSALLEAARSLSVSLCGCLLK